MHRARVPILSGTDLHNAYIYPGFSLHDELQLLVDSGLTPLDALRTATSNAASYLGLEVGEVKPGKLADLVLLGGNPLEDIRHTRSIRGVVINGRYLDRKALDGLLRESEKAATRDE
jgi:imidazolonepropionase-like amidohydrolase